MFGYSSLRQGGNFRNKECSTSEKQDHPAFTYVQGTCMILTGSEMAAQVSGI